jgi:pyridoxine kinase
MPILSIQSHVAYGHVGNSSAVFPLQRRGHEVWPIHTVQFAAHTGYGPPKGRVFDAVMIDEVMQGIAERPDFVTCEAVLSGYMGSVEMGEAILRAVERVKAANPSALYCCDPVMGDIGRGFFVRSDMPDFIRGLVVPTADILTPNLFELEVLSGLKCSDLASVRLAIDTVHRMGPRIILLTSGATEGTPPDQFDMLASDATGVWRVRTPRMAFSPNGAGDLVAALFLSRYLQSRSVVDALGFAASAVHGVLQATYDAHSAELLLIKAQNEFVSPLHFFEPELIG